MKLGISWQLFLDYFQMSPIDAATLSQTARTLKLTDLSKFTHFLLFLLFSRWNAKEIENMACVLKLQGYIDLYYSLRQSSAIYRWYLERKQGNVLKKLTVFKQYSPARTISIAVGLFVIEF